MTNTTPTKGQQTAADVSALLRARNPLIWITTREEARVERLLFEAAANAGFIASSWDVAQGVTETLSGTPQSYGDPDPDRMLQFIATRAQGGPRRDCWLMRDLHAWIDGPAGARTIRMLRNLARTLPTVPRERAQAIIVISPSTNIPPELQGHATVIDWPMPDRAEIAAILDGAIAGLPEEMKATAAPNGTRELAIDAAVGLSGEEAAACYARSLVQFRRIDPVVVATEKKRVIAREGGLEWIDPIPGGLDAVGGLDNMKTWLKQRASAYSPAARAYGVQKPKGILIVGVSGTGKSLSAKAVPTAWSIPCLRFDLGAQKSKYMGESEGNVRKNFKTIEAMGRCVVWFDEIEKAMAGSTTAQGGDGGVAADQLGAILTWMNERTSDAFVIATANSIEDLPPEFLRKGRFDIIFFVDLPNDEERRAVLQAALKANGRTADGIDLDEVASRCRDFTGAEIAAIVPDAIITGFNDGARPINTADLIAAAATVVPLSKTAGDKIAKLREWAKGRATPASAQSTTTAPEARRQLDF